MNRLKYQILGRIQSGVHCPLGKVPADLAQLKKIQIDVCPLPFGEGTGHRSGLLGRKEFRFLNESREFGHGIYLELAGEVRPMKLYRPFMDPQIGGDLLVELPLHDMPENLTFAIRQQSEFAFGFQSMFSSCPLSALVAGVKIGSGSLAHRSSPAGRATPQTEPERW